MENNKPKSTDFDIGDYLLYQMASLGGLVCFITVDDTLFLSVCESGLLLLSLYISFYYDLI